MPYQAFACADGHLVVTVGNDTQFARFADLLGHPEWAEAPAYATNAARVGNREVLVSWIAEILRTRGRDAWLAEFEARGIPAGPINTLGEVFDDPQVKHRGMQRTLKRGGLEVPQVANPLRFDGEPGRPASAKELVRQAQRGDAEAFDSLARMVGDRCLAIAVRILRDIDLAEDAVQAAMEQAWRRRSSLREPGRMRWWLDRIVVREAIRVNRRPWWSRLTVTYCEEHASLLPDPAGETTPQRLALTAAFAALTPGQRGACVLHLHMGYGVVETAELMGAGVETTRSRLRLARRRLQADLLEDES